MKKKKEVNKNNELTSFISKHRYLFLLLLFLYFFMKVNIDIFNFVYINKDMLLSKIKYISII